jgi:hypothetical protein
MTLIDVVGPVLMIISTLILTMGAICLSLLGVDLLNYRK